MLGSRLHPKFPSLVWQIAIHRSLILLIILHFIDGANVHVAAQQLQNITIPVTSSQIIYTPFICNASIQLADPQLCSGAWRLSSSNNSVSTTGPTSSSGQILPQLFFEVQASHLSINTLSSSNASVNITISAGGIRVSTVFNSSVGAVSIVGLMQNQTTLLTVTFIPTAGPTLFGLESLIMTVPDNLPLSSFFPTQSLPSFAPTPTSITSSSGSASATAAPDTTKRTMVAEAVGITLGLGLGLTAIAVGLFYYWKRRKNDNGIDEAKSGWSRDSFSPSHLIAS